MNFNLISALIFCCFFASIKSQHQKQQPKVAIIGAGVAEDGWLQLGAQYIDGNKNPLFDIAKNLGVVDYTVEDYEHLDISEIRYGNCPIQESDIEAFKDFIAPLNDNYRYVAENDEKKSYDETIKRMYDKDYANFLKLSLRTMTEWDVLDGNDVSYSTTKTGYTAILSYLSSKIPTSKFHLNYRIANINFSGEETKLTLANGTVINEEFNYVIVTTALGHLKKFARKMFIPQLPDRLLKAIDKIGMGTSEKIFLEYSDTTWMDTFLTPLPVPGCQGQNEVGEIEMEFNTFQKVSWTPNVIMAWIAGHGPEKVDKISDKELSKILTKLFQNIYLNTSIPEPLAIIRSKWTQNDLFGGSYSYVSYEQAQSRIRHSDLSIPVIKDGKIRIQFAGEATHHQMFQTAVGALLSGRRESDRIIYNI
uniref:Amine oxidase domain-containing protein n=1 Tax=Panagrolaimus sp. ES5 TaxID=591445 RepID=A0AC34F574_9BILA